MIIHGKTIIGRRRENQDKYLIYNLNKQLSFLAVADGMGGVIGGGIASQLVIEAAENVIKKESETINNLTDLKFILQTIFLEANSAIRARIREEPILNGMGSTLCCLLLYGSKYVWGNIGDSRIYLFDNTKFRRITKDHTQIEDFIQEDSEKITKEMITNFGHLLTKTINGGDDKPDIYPQSSAFEMFNFNQGVLLCTDGILLDKYGDDSDRFYQCYIESESIERFVERLISNSYEQGSSDNITCIAALNVSDKFN